MKSIIMFFACGKSGISSSVAKTFNHRTHAWPLGLAVSLFLTFFSHLAASQNVDLLRFFV